MGLIQLRRASGPIVRLASPSRFVMDVDLAVKEKYSF